MNRQAYQKAYRETHPHGPEYRAKQEARRSRFQRTLELWKHTQGCAECGTKKGKLDYHHLDQATKRCNVARMWSYSLRSLLDEIAKCVVLCQSYHKIETWKERMR